MYLTNETTNVLTAGDSSTEPLPLYTGYIACFVAVIFFGSNFVPVKKFETGEGVFFQWVVCCGIWLVGVIISLCRYPHSQFYPEIMIGGIIWCTGNMLTVPIIKTVGLGQGILIWASFNTLVGWITSRFGLFGVEAKIPNNVVYNYIGAALCLVSSIFYVMIRSSTSSAVDGLELEVDETQQPLADDVAPGSINTRTLGQPPVITNAVKSTDDETFLDNMSPRKKRIFGVSASIFAGCLYGLQFLPVDLVQQSNPGASRNGLDHCFAHWTGIFVASTAFFVIYASYMGNNPRVFPRAILPGLLCGALWAVAEAGWFVANSTLTQTISFPIIASGPSMVGALWGVYFKEIRGKRNYIIMGVAFSITTTGAILTGLSALEKK